ncbi:hypothetical protein Hanom_Chr10g00931851 [Helianthus anomalus]
MKPTGVNEDFRERSEEATSRRWRNLCCVHRRNHKRISYADTGDKPANHEKRVVCSDPHQDCSNKENSSSQNNCVPATNPVGCSPGGG